MRGSEKIRDLDEIPLNNRDKEKLFNTLKMMPPDVQSTIFSNDFFYGFKMVASNFPEFVEDTPPNDLDDFWDFVRQTSNIWFYQVTTLPSSDSELMIISRIPRERESNRKKGGFVKPLLVLLLILVAIAVIVIINIFKNITRSINIIQDQMQNIADGNLNDKIVIPEKRANEIISITTNLEKMRLSLIEAQNKRNKFIMGMSHDLRTPVAIIKGYTEAISDGMINDGEEMEKTISLIDTKTSQLQGMIDTLINFVKLESNNWRENLIEESIVEAINNFAKDAEATCSVFKRYMKKEITFTKDIKVPLDRQLINRAFENLLSNAVRYTKENDTITIRANTDESEKNVILQIEDTGCGIEKDDLSNIFELFYRGTNSRREEGMGIGLSVVKSIIDTHGWKISVESEKDKGTVFTITIPVN